MIPVIRRPLQLGILAALSALTITGFAVETDSAAADAAPAVLHVDCSARTSGDGSSAKPVNTLAAVNEHGPFSPGAEILLKRGTTCKGRLMPTGSGTSHSPIVLGAYGHGARPIVAGGGTPNATGAVQLTNVQYWTVQDLHITNRTAARTTSRYRTGLMFWNLHGGRLHGLTATNVQVDDVVSNLSYTGGNPREWGGIVALSSGEKSGFDGLLIQRSAVSKVGRTGIAVINHNYSKSPDTRLRVTDNRLRDIRGDGILVFGSRNARIDHNVVARASSLFPCPQCENISRYTANAAVWPAQSTNVVIDHNEVYGTRVSNGDGEAFDVDASAKNVIVEYNYAHDNAGGAVLFCGSVDAVVRFNIFQNNKKSTFAFIGTMPATRTSIYNNTVFVSKRTGAGTVRYFNGPKGKDIRFFNNIVYNYGSGYWYWPTKPWTRSNTIIGAHRSGEPRGAGWTSRDPHLAKAGSGKLGFGSLAGYKHAKTGARQHGIAIPSSVKRDFFGKKINPHKPPRGAAG